MAKDQNLEEVLIARNNDTGQVGAVTGLNENGTPKMTDVKSAKLSDLVKFSKGQNPLEAFLSNFVRQCKNPTTFGFFRVPADRYDTVGTVIGDLAKDPVANADMLKNNKVDLPQATQDNKQEAAQTTEQPKQSPAGSPQEEQLAQTNAQASAKETRHSAIDEGAMDEKNGMNFSEYMAILSGNTDLLEKAKFEKRIASLESERKAHNKGIADSKFRLQTISHDIANNEAAIERMKADVARYEAVVKRDKDGNPLNNLTIDTCNLSDEKNMGIHLQGLAQRTDTHGQYKRIGEVYGFPISIISERTLVDGKETIQNRFVVEGNYKYKFNNGFIAMSDTHAACMNFVNALEKIPGIIAQYEERTAKLKADVPQLEAIISKSWGKEDELKQLKSDLAALDRKITAALTPTHEVPDDRMGVNKEEQDGEENKKANTAEIPEADNGSVTPSRDTNKTMVAEPSIIYNNYGGIANNLRKGYSI